MASGLYDPYEIKQQQLAERRKEAMKAAAEAQNQLTSRTGRMVGGQWINPHFTERLSDLISAGYSTYEAAKAAKAEQEGAASELSAAQTYLKNRPQAREEAVDLPLLARPAEEGAPETDTRIGTRTVEPTQEQKVDYLQQGILKHPSLRGILTAEYERQLGEPERQEARQERVTARGEDKVFRAEEAQKNREQQATQFAERMNDSKLSREERAEAARRHDEMMFELQKGNQELRRLQLEQAFDARTERKQEKANAPLPYGATEKLSNLSKHVEQADTFVSTFKPTYSGVTGELSRQAGAKLPAGMTTQNAKDSADWWNSYQSRKNEVRHDLFGSALTSTEKAEWEASDITPTMPAEQIQKNLARRAELERRAFDKMAAATTAGTRAEQIEALRPKPAGQGYGVTGSWEAPEAPKPGTERGGYVYTGGDPSKPTSWRKK